jgi:hypothetical protein
MSNSDGLWNQAINLGLLPGESGSYTTITSYKGIRLVVAKKMFPQFLGFINELEFNVDIYQDQSIGAYENSINGKKVLSQHDFGNAIDLNRNINYFGMFGNKFNLKDGELISLCNRWGLRWGGEMFKTKPMHFEGVTYINRNDIPTIAWPKGYRNGI